MDINNKNTCFITLKEHKENFLNNPTVRLITPAKSKLRRISEAMLDNINKCLYTSFTVNQWKNTASVTDWLQRIEKKDLHKFIMFNMNNFYPPIQEGLLNKGLRFSQEYIDITNKDAEIIYHARKSLLFNEKDTWRKDPIGFLNVPMKACDGAEACELVGTYTLTPISEKYDFIVMAG